MIYIAPCAPLLIGQYDEANAQPMVSHDNLLARGTITNGTLPTGAPRLNAVTEDTSEFWQPTAADTLRATFAGSEIADVAFFANHTLSGKLVKVQKYNGSTWVDVASYTPTNNAPFLIVFPRDTATGWGVSISAACVIGIAWIGPRVIIPGGVLPDYKPVWAAHNVTKYPGVTRRGNFRGQRIERTGASLSASFMPIAHDFARDDLSVFRTRYNEGRAFIWASAPNVFSDDAAYCWAPDGASFAPTIMAGGELVNLSLSMEAFVNA